MQVSTTAWVAIKVRLSIALERSQLHRGCWIIESEYTVLILCLSRPLQSSRLTKRERTLLGSLLQNLGTHEGFRPAFSHLGNDEDKEGSHDTHAFVLRSFRDMCALSSGRNHLTDKSAVYEVNHYSPILSPSHRPQESCL